MSVLGGNGGLLPDERGERGDDEDVRERRRLRVELVRRVIFCSDLLLLLGVGNSLVADGGVDGSEAVLLTGAVVGVGLPFV